MPFRFVHAADLHLDSPLRSLALRDPALAALIDTATRQAFSAVIALCLAENVDALLIAGDLYDGAQTSMKTARFLADELGKLHAAGVRTFIIRGNHDALSRITRELVLPDSVTVFGARAGVVEIAPGSGPQVAIHGVSFAQPQAPESLLPKYRAPVAGAVNIGLMHTSLNGAPGHDVYAPCALADLQSSGFRYWALGHIHARAVWEGPCAVVMAGMPQGRDVNEAGAKGATLVTVADDGGVTLDFRPTALAQFARLDLDATGVADWRALVGALGALLAQARAQTDAAHLVARLRVTGATPLAWAIRRDADLLAEEARRAGEALGGVWIERVGIDAAPPDAAAAPDGAGFEDLRRLIETEILPGEAAAAEAGEIAAALCAALPRELRAMLGADEAAVAASVAALAREGAAEVLAHLRGAAGGAAGGAGADAGVDAEGDA